MSAAFLIALIALIAVWCALGLSIVLVYRSMGRMYNAAPPDQAPEADADAAAGSATTDDMPHDWPLYLLAFGAAVAASAAWPMGWAS